MPKKSLSIVVPAYNAQTSIAACIRSITPHDNVEIIIINDGSTDNTEKIINKLKQERRDIKYVKINNCGPANARNLGVKSAKGAYICFIDADDTVSPGAINELLMHIQHNDVDMLVFGYNIVTPNNKIISSYRYNDVKIHTKSLLNSHLAALYQENLLNQVWNKVFSRKLLLQRNLLFENLHYGEDRLFVFDALAHSKTVNIIDKCLYNYGAGYNESLVTKYHDDKLEICHKIDIKIRELATAGGHVSITDTEIYDYMYIKGVLSCLTNLDSPTCTMSSSDKRAFVDDLLNNSQVAKSLQQTFNRPFYFQLIIRAMNTKSPIIVLSMAKFIGLTSALAPKLLIKAKHEK